MEPLLGRPTEFGFCGIDVYAQRVHELAHNHNTRGPEGNVVPYYDRNLSLSWCIGRTLRWLAMWNIAQVFIIVVAFIYAIMFSNCHDGNMAYPTLFVWTCLCIYGLIHLYVEFQCFKYFTIPYFMQCREWPFLGRDVGFSLWYFMSIITSLIHVVGMVTPSLFAGVALGQFQRRTCYTYEREKIWQQVMMTSCCLPGLLEEGSYVLLIFWFFTLLPFIHCFMWLMPECCPWNLSENGKDEKNVVYGKRLELDVDKTRFTDSNARYAYIAWPFQKLWCRKRDARVRLTGLVYFTLAENSGMSSIAMRANDYAYAKALSCLDGKTGMASYARFDQIDKSATKPSVDEFFKAAKHFHCITPRLTNRLILHGLLGGGFQCQIQVTFFALTKASTPADTSHDWQAYVAIASAFLKVLMILPSIWDFLFKVKALHDCFMRSQNQATGRGENMSYHGREWEDFVRRHAHDELWYLRKVLFGHCIFLILVMYNFVWAAIKFVMVYKCPGHMWNWNLQSLLNPMSGCVPLS